MKIQVADGFLIFKDVSRDKERIVTLWHECNNSQYSGEVQMREKYWLQLVNSLDKKSS